MVLLVALAGCQTVGLSTSSSLDPKELPISEPIPNAPGSLLYANGIALRTLEPSAKEIKDLVTFPSDRYPDAPVASPDGTQVAFSLYLAGQDASSPTTGVDLWLMASDGGNQREILRHTEPGEWLVSGAWTPDGSALYFTRRSQAAAARIERVKLDGSGRQVIVENAEDPTISSDGASLAYVVRDPQADTPLLAVATSDGANERRLLGGLGFNAIAAPRFRPNGSQILFAAVGGPGQAVPEQSNTRSSGLVSWLGPATASAHGIPWELWVVNPDGSALERLTDIQEDTPIAAWSPDGKWIAMKGELGIYVLDAETTEIRRLAQELAGLGITWLPD
jgi:Tol biopolymer transport system component